MKQLKNNKKINVSFYSNGLLDNNKCYNNITEYDIEPCITRKLFKEAFKNGEAKISSSVLKKRLPNALKDIEKKERKIYFSSKNTIRKVKKIYKNFIKLIEKEEKKSKKFVTILVKINTEK